METQVSALSLLDLVIFSPFIQLFGRSEIKIAIFAKSLVNLRTILFGTGINFSQFETFNYGQIILMLNLTLFAFLFLHIFLVYFFSDNHLISYRETISQNHIDRLQFFKDKEGTIEKHFKAHMPITSNDDKSRIKQT